MTESKEAAKTYCDNVRNATGRDSDPVNAFQAGAQWKSEQSPWIRTEDKMPEDNQIVLTSSGIYGTKLLEWNTSHALWFHEGGEDAYCERDKIDAWMPIPE